MWTKNSMPKQSQQKRFITFLWGIAGSSNGLLGIVFKKDMFNHSANLISYLETGLARRSLKVHRMSTLPNPLASLLPKKDQVLHHKIIEKGPKTCFVFIWPWLLSWVQDKSCPQALAWRTRLQNHWGWKSGASPSCAGPNNNCQISISANKDVSTQASKSQQASRWKPES